MTRHRCADPAAKLVAGATFSGCAGSPNGCGNGDWRSGNTTDAPSPHGTHVAGIAAASTNNGIGIAGVAPDARIMPVKALTEAGGSFEEIAAAIRWAVDNSADVSTMSPGALPGVHALVMRQRRVRLLRGHLDGDAAARRGGRRAADRAGSQRRAGVQRAEVDRANAAAAVAAP